MMPIKTTKIDFTSRQWQHLLALSFEPFEFGEGDALTEGQWTALADMCLGKNYRLTQAYLNSTKAPNRFVDEARQLRRIAGKIFKLFPPETDL